jgi:hypothetical protein
MAFKGLILPFSLSFEHGQRGSAGELLSLAKVKVATPMARRPSRGDFEGDRD